MLPEQKMYHDLKNAVGSLLHMTRVEDSLGHGVSDVTWSNHKGLQGWVELKVIPAWPVRVKTLVKVERFTPQQKLFLLNTGPGSWFLLKVDTANEWLLFDWQSAQEVGYWTKEGLYQQAFRIWKRIPPGREFVDAIIQTILNPNQGGR